jgi:molybdenum-dependent DNA-binding transcriptional regulator ModE
MRGNKRPDNVIPTSTIDAHLCGVGRALEPPEVAELLRHIADGGTPTSAAKLFGCSTVTVRHHVAQQAKIMRITRTK